MSFSKQVKQEISKRAIERPCCVTAACYGVACFSKYFDTKGLVLHTERVFVAQWAKAMFGQAGVEGKVYVRGEDGASYEFSVKEPYEVEKMLAMLGHTGEETALRIHHDNFLCKDCFAAFLAGAFLASGTIVTPEKSYNLELLTPRTQMAQDFAKLMQEHEYTPGLAKRKGLNVIYFKSSEQIEDLLTLMGASGSALEIMQCKVYKDFRNRANRITNCETANIDKIVANSRDTLQAIRLLEERGVLDTLPKPLREAAVLRKKNPDLSLTDLSALFEEPVSKSGLSHRYKKIRQKAAELGGETSEVS